MQVPCHIELTAMSESSDKEKSGAKKGGPGSKGYKEPGWRQIKTTSVFRVVNPELFIKPVSGHRSFSFVFVWDLTLGMKNYFFHIYAHYS